jgi:ABC-2 type transport system ATP-binding protein
MSEAVIEAAGLAKSYGSVRALDGLDFSVARGRIVGLIGRNGAGKTTALKAVLGLTPFRGNLTVLGLDPFRQRPDLMQRVSFIADVAVLPRWIKVQQLLDYVAASHPRFDRDRAMRFLDGSEIRLKARVKTLSKGMVTQLHLAVVMAIDASLLVLDEPTLGLDIIYRKKFYDALLNDYFDHSRTIIVSTHQVEEIEHLLTDILFIDQGRLLLDSSIEGLAQRYCEVRVARNRESDARALGPIAERQSFGQSLMLFEDRAIEDLQTLGETRTPPVADLFVAKVTGGHA